MITTRAPDGANKKLQKKSGDHKTALAILAMVCLLEAGSSP